MMGIRNNNQQEPTKYSTQCRYVFANYLPISSTKSSNTSDAANLCGHAKCMSRRHGASALPSGPLPQLLSCLGHGKSTPTRVSFTTAKHSQHRTWVIFSYIPDLHWPAQRSYLFCINHANAALPIWGVLGLRPFPNVCPRFVCCIFDLSWNKVSVNYQPLVWLQYSSRKYVRSQHIL